MYKNNKNKLRLFSTEFNIPGPIPISCIKPDFYLFSLETLIKK